MTATATKPRKKTSKRTTTKAKAVKAAKAVVSAKTQPASKWVPIKARYHQLSREPEKPLTRAEVDEIEAYMTAIVAEHPLMTHHKHVMQRLIATARAAKR